MTRGTPTIAVKQIASCSTLVFCVFLVACSTGPEPSHEKIVKEALPNVIPPSRWQAGQAEPARINADDWWRVLGNPELNSLISQALSGNYDIRIAAARIDRAQAYAEAAGAALVPAVSVKGRGGTKLGGDGSGIAGAFLTASWEIDLWGRVRAQRDAASAQFDAARFDASAARQSVAAAVARAWLSVVGAQLDEELKRSILTANEHLLELARERELIGQGDLLDVAQSESSVEAARMEVQQAEYVSGETRRALEVLTGRYPDGTVHVTNELPDFPRDIPAGLPSELLERRPDVIAAERRVDAAFYAVKAANAARLPRIALTAGVNTISSDLFVLKNRENPAFSLGGSLLMPVFDGGALAAQVDESNAEKREAIAQYGQVALNAFSEVEGSLSDVITLTGREGLLEDQLHMQELMLKLAQDRWHVGSGDFRAVLQQELRVRAISGERDDVGVQRRVQYVNLLLALGGAPEGTP